LDGERLPCAVVDLDAVDHNQALLTSRLERDDILVRAASKSVRVPAILRHLLDNSERFVGLMTYSATETGLLAEQGFDDLLLAYPVGRAREARTLAGLAAAGKNVIATVDGPEHVALLAAAASDAGATLGVCIDVDVSWRPLGGRVHIGVRRSPVRSADDALAVAAEVQRSDGLQLRAILAYEAQIASLRQTNPGSRHLDPMRRFIRNRSVPLAAARRREVVDALRAAGHELTVVNGGGTGSVSSTSADPTVTEVTAGSGFLCPHLFDGYDGLPLKPAAFFAIGVVRWSDQGFVTCQGGGYPASGGAGPDRLPVVHLPHGLTPLGMEGFGEVQTPFELSPVAPTLALGDPVLCRHAKAGELAERFNEVLLVRGDEIVERAKTYRGLGACTM